MRQVATGRAECVGWLWTQVCKPGRIMTAAPAYDTADTFDWFEKQSPKVTRIKDGDVLLMCPLSGEKAPSWHLTLKADGKIIGHCFSCQRRTPDHAEALGIPMAAFIPEPPDGSERVFVSRRPMPRREPRPSKPPEPECLGRYVEHGYPMIGKPDRPSVGETWFIREWSPGCPVAWKVRRTCVRCGERTFVWRQPDDPGRTKSGKPVGAIPLSGLWDLYQALDRRELVQIYITEGDSDADAVRQAGQLACTAGGTTDWKPVHYDQLDGIAFATICADKDEPGRAHADEVKAQLKARGIRSRIVEPVVGKDVRDHLNAGHRLDELVAVP